MKMIAVTSMATEQTPHPKFGSDVRMGDAACAPGGYEKVYGSHNEAFCGEQGSLPRKSGMV